MTTLKADLINYSSHHLVNNIGGSVENVKGCSLTPTLQPMDYHPSDVALSQMAGL